MKSSDEIKKGAEHCTAKGDCRGCPYIKNLHGCKKELTSDALAYIRQLEAERDAAVGDIRLAYESYVGRCETCKHVGNQLDCDEPEACGMCKVETCKCRSCGKDDRNWEWRGIQKEG